MGKLENLNKIYFNSYLIIIPKHPSHYSYLWNLSYTHIIYQT